MKAKTLVFLWVLLFLAGIVHAADEPGVEFFSPQGIVKGVRQVSVRFSEQMVPFGDPRGLVEPFDIDCPEKGEARWADGKNWIYDFDRNLSAGIRCSFSLKAGVKTLAGKEVAGQRQFVFSTGGPAVVSSKPPAGSTYIDEEQVFILTLDAEAAEESILSNVSFSVEGIYERIGVRVLSGDEREKILKAAGYLPPGPKLLLQAKQRFPANSNLTFVWGKGILSKSGIAVENEQIFAFRTRGPFTAEFHCGRENPRSGCLPIAGMSVNFSAPLEWTEASKIRLIGPKGKVWKVEKGTGEEDSEAKEKEEEKEKNVFVSAVSFPAPFPESADFNVELPAGLKDDAGRTLSNADKFPLSVKTGDFPPLAKFSAYFGIIELNAEPVLPVTLRNIEPKVMARLLKVNDKGMLAKAKDITESIKGKILMVQPEKTDANGKEIFYWFKKKPSFDREVSIFTAEEARKSKKFSIEKPGGAKAFEVVGIPLKKPGLYVVEVESAILGSSLLGETRPIFVPTVALVTNLSVHFKQGRESSLVWVTSLDSGMPVKDASVLVMNCAGAVLWEGDTDLNGIARIQKELAVENSNKCPDKDYFSDGSLLVTARLKGDMSFVFSSWDNGIEPWRFNLPDSYTDYRLVAPHTVFDRTLLRAGETIHMKHIIRKRTGYGFSLVPETELPKTALIEHYGSEQQYELPLKWDANGAAETDWNIPKDAKLGHYRVFLPQKAASGHGYAPYYDALESGAFRVEEFRVPLMKGIIQPPAEPLVSPVDVTVDLMVRYLAGGGAGGQRVKLRSQIQPGRIRNYYGFDGFTFANGPVKPGLVKQDRYYEYEESYEGDGEAPQRPQGISPVKTMEVVLDSTGSARATIDGIEKPDKPAEMLAELEFIDPNGEVQTVSSKIPIWPSRHLVGIKTDSWALTKDALKFQIAVVDTHGRPVAGAPVEAELFQRKTYSHRKRLIGGFYAYEHFEEIKKAGALCKGSTDDKGLLICEAKSPVSASVIIQAKTSDASGAESYAGREVWVSGDGQWWFNVGDSDRIDLLPEKKRYEPGETARFQVRMPFREATVLVTVEREGVMEAFVKRVSGKAPVIEVPVKGRFAPNVFVSALIVRGRVGDVKPTAIVDLGRPTYRLGISQIDVGWKSFELKVKVSPERETYKVRERAQVKVEVRTSEGKIPPPGSEVAVAAIDEGLLELMANKSWDILGAMMKERAYQVRTSTAQMHVVGRRHFGLKAIPHGGGGGMQSTRELFDTLLLWKGRVILDDKGEAVVEVPLNDSMTSFRVAAIATAGPWLFGSGQSSIRTTQDLMLFSGIAPLVREGDIFSSLFTVRNTTGKDMEIDVTCRVKEIEAQLQPKTLTLKSGEARELAWDIRAPFGVETLSYEVEAKTDSASDRIKVVQKVVPAVPVRTFQATISQVEKDFKVAVKQPQDALAGRGGINVELRGRLSDGMAGVSEYMKNYPYTCFEQKVSRAVALKDRAMWERLVNELPAYLDSDGLVKYFPTMNEGSDTLTSYLISISSEAGLYMPRGLMDSMTNGLEKFVSGSLRRSSAMRTADLTVRKLAAIEALSRRRVVNPSLLSSIHIEPNLWPTSAVIDWFNILKMAATVPDRDKMLGEAEQILRSRLSFQGTTMGFSTEESDHLWWLMVSSDVNAMRLILTMADNEGWKEDLPRLVRGALMRQRRGAWDLTGANAWGVVAMDKFSSIFENTPVQGRTDAALSGKTEAVEWGEVQKKGELRFQWPSGEGVLSIRHEGTGRPWVTVQSLAAIPLKEQFSSGYRIKKTLTPVEQATPGIWSKGDIARVRLEIDAQSDMTWVAVSDPVPSGSAILGSGLGRDSTLATMGEKAKGWVWPAYEERSFEAFRAYYEYVPKGRFMLEYTVRLNQSGSFNLPETRVEALYAPEMFGEAPNPVFKVSP